MKMEYVTSNRGKFEEARLILSDWQLEQVNVDLLETQGDRREIMQHKAKEALRILQRPLIVEDVSFCCPALQGLPGPYVKEFLLRLGAEGLADLIHRYDDHSAQAICTVAFIQPGSDPVCYEGITEGTVVKPRGGTEHSNLSWNTIFLPKGRQKTFGEHTMQELSEISMRRIALMQLKDYLIKLTN